MFGKAEWFEPKKFGWGLRPVKWQGWVYTGAWGSAIVMPFLALLVNSGFLEALIWMAATIALLVFDVRQIRRRIPSLNSGDTTDPKDDVLYIGDDDDRLATANFDMELRR